MILRPDHKLWTLRALLFMAEVLTSQNTTEYYYTNRNSETDSRHIQQQPINKIRGELIRVPWNPFQNTLPIFLKISFPYPVSVLFAVCYVY